MSQDPVQRPGHLVEVERVDEQSRVVDLPAVAAEPAPELLLLGPSSPRRLLLQGAERFEVTLQRR